MQPQLAVRLSFLATALRPLRSHDALHPDNLTGGGRRASLGRCSSFLKPGAKPTPPALQRSTSNQGWAASVATPTNVGAGTNRGFVFQKKSTPAITTKVCSSMLLLQTTSADTVLCYLGSWEWEKTCQCQSQEGEYSKCVFCQEAQANQTTITLG